jgi:hypothetical protein
MAISTKRRIRYLAGASCTAALLAGAVGVTSAQAMPQTTKATTQSPSAAPQGGCTGYHYDQNHNRIWDPPGCTPP